MPGRLPTSDDFPKTVKLDIVPPPNNDPATNILLLLHGLGDTQHSFTKLAQQLNLPETACISLRGPKALLDLEGAHWGDDIIFDSSNGGLDADAGLKESTELLKVLINEVLVGKCGYEAREVMMFGFGQGGMAALSTAVALHPTSLAGIISIGAGLPSSSPTALVSKCATPILICAGTSGAVTSTTEDQLKRVFEHVQVSRYRRAGDGMPSNRDEMMPVMQFFARRLRSRRGVPEGSVEVS